MLGGGCEDIDERVNRRGENTGMTITLPRAHERLTQSEDRLAEAWYRLFGQIATDVNSINSTLSALSGDVGGLPTFGTAATEDTGTSGHTVPFLDGINAWSKQQYFAMATLTDAASIAWPLDTAQVATVTLTDNRTLANPTNMKAGGTYQLIVRQDATGSRTLAYGSAYKWPSGTAPTLTTAASSIDLLTFLSDGSSMFGVAVKAFA